MSTVRIRNDLFERITKLAVKTTIETLKPTRQSELIQFLLDRVLEDYTARELIAQYHEMIKQKELENRASNV